VCALLKGGREIRATHLELAPTSSIPCVISEQENPKRTENAKTPTAAGSKYAREQPENERRMSVT
jgi:hypothetical protein